jgi:RNA recognition motif-containing protein
MHRNQNLFQHNDNITNANNVVSRSVDEQNHRQPSAFLQQSLTCDETQSRKDSRTNHRIAFKNEVFVGNLSYFCEEQDLFNLFDAYVEVTHVRIVRNPENNKTLMFGFVTLSTVHEAKEMAKLLHGQLFMGRKLRLVDDFFMLFI